MTNRDIEKLEVDARHLVDDVSDLMFRLDGEEKQVAIENAIKVVLKKYKDKNRVMLVALMMMIDLVRCQQLDFGKMVVQLDSEED